MITINEINYPNYGKCVSVSNGTIDFVATLDIGPRIIRFGFVGGENEFFEDVNKTTTVDNAEHKAAFGDGNDWWIMGGHRLWNSPEAMPRTYYPENEPVKCEEIPNGVRLTPPPQRWTNFQNEIEITITGDNEVDVIHKITNIGAWHTEFAAWAVSVMAQGGFEVVPQPVKDTYLLANRWLGIWPYTQMNDKRVYWGDKYITLKQYTSVNRPIKFGINSEHGWAAYFNHGNMFVKFFDVDGEVYPDNGMNFETYTNPNFLEIETLSELKNVAPGDTITHKEKWKLYKDVPRPSNDEAEIAEIIGKYL